MRPMAMPRPPSHNSTASAAFAGMALPRLWARVLSPFPNPTNPHPAPATHDLNHARFRRPRWQVMLYLGSGGDTRPVRCGNHVRCMIRSRPAVGATDGQEVSLDRFGETATGRLRNGLTKAVVGDGARGSAFGRVKTGGLGRPVRSTVAEITPRVPDARLPSCGPRPHGERPDRHCAASLASPPRCAPLTLSRASCRRRRKGRPSGQGGAH